MRAQEMRAKVSTARRPLGRPRRTFGQSITTGPFGDMITLSGCRSRCRPVAAAGRAGEPVGAGDLVKPVVEPARMRR